MKTFNVTIESRNKNSIRDFFFFFNEQTLHNKNIMKKCFQKNKKKKRLTILKSPHVNKKAQEQFESSLFRKQFSIQATKNLKYLIFLKKLNYELFPDINIKLTCIMNHKKTKKLGLYIFDPNNFRVNKYKSYFSNNLNLKNLNKLEEKNDTISKSLLTQKAGCLLKTFDLYGGILRP